MSSPTAGVEGDTRLFVMTGRPLRHRGRYAAFRCLRAGADLRSNVHAGGTKARAQITETELRLAEIVRPKLVQDGMYKISSVTDLRAHVSTDTAF